MRVIFVGALIGCGAVAPAPVPTAIAPPAVIKPSAITMAELGDPGIVARIPQRTRVGWGTGRTPIDSRPVVPVIGETGNRVRIVSEDDDARLAIWIDRADLLTTIVAPIRSGDRSSDTGVWLEPGADIDTTPSGDVTLRDDKVHVTGRVRADALGTVWVGTEPSMPASSHTELVPKTKIRQAPRADAPVLAETIADVGASVLATGDWTEIVVQRAGARIRGYVRAVEIAHDQIEIGHGRGFGNALGISDTDRIDVPAGACFFDHENGEVIGVNLATKRRYGTLPRGTPWASVYVNTLYWGVTTVAIHQVGDTWELCNHPTGR